MGILFIFCRPELKIPVFLRVGGVGPCNWSLHYAVGDRCWIVCVWAVGPTGCWTNRLSDQRAVGPMGCQTNGISGVGPTGCQVSDQWAVGPTGCQTKMHPPMILPHTYVLLPRMYVILPSTYVIPPRMYMLLSSYVCDTTSYVHHTVSYVRGKFHVCTRQVVRSNMVSECPSYAPDQVIITSKSRPRLFPCPVSVSRR